MEVIQGRGNVFEGIGFVRAEAASLKILADLMLDVRKHILSDVIDACDVIAEV